MASAADLKDYFAALDAQLAPLTLAQKIRRLVDQESQWAKRETVLWKWAKAPGNTPNPYAPPLTAFTIAAARNELDTRIEQARAEQRAAFDNHMAACRALTPREPANNSQLISKGNDHESSR